jgi:hypothetical protein
MYWLYQETLASVSPSAELGIMALHIPHRRNIFHFDKIFVFPFVIE